MNHDDLRKLASEMGKLASALCLADQTTPAVNPNAWRDMANRWSATATSARILAILDELDALRKDASRYRFLRAHAIGWLGDAIAMEEPDALGTGTEAEALDRMVDQAMADEDKAWLAKAEEARHGGYADKAEVDALLAEMRNEQEK